MEVNMANQENISTPDNLDLIMDVPLELTVVVGEAKKSINEVLALNSGSIVELEKTMEEPVEILINGELVAEGEIVVVDESFGVRITNILTKEERLKHLRK